MIPTNTVAGVMAPQMDAYTQAYNAGLAAGAKNAPQQPAATSRVNDTNPLSTVDAILRGIQERAARSSNAVIEATNRANQRLNLQRDPVRTKAIDDRRREMNVVSQRGRTEGSKRRSEDFRNKVRARNKAKADAKAAERAELDAYVDNIIASGDVPSDMDRAQAIHDQNIAESMAFQEQAAQERSDQRLAEQTAAEDEIRRRAALQDQYFQDADGNVIPAADADIAQATAMAEMPEDYDFEAMDLRRAIRKLEREEAEARGGLSQDRDAIAMREAGAAAARSNPLYDPTTMSALGTAPQGYSRNSLARERMQTGMDALNPELQDLGSRMLFPGPGGGVARTARAISGVRPARVVPQRPSSVPPQRPMSIPPQRAMQPPVVITQPGPIGYLPAPPVTPPMAPHAQYMFPF